MDPCLTHSSLRIILATVGRQYNGLHSLLIWPSITILMLHKLFYNLEIQAFSMQLNGLVEIWKGRKCCTISDFSLHVIFLILSHVPMYCRYKTYTMAKGTSFLLTGNIGKLESVVWTGTVHLSSFLPSHSTVCSVSIDQAWLFEIPICLCIICVCISPAWCLMRQFLQTGYVLFTGYQVVFAHSPSMLFNLQVILLRSDFKKLGLARSF